MNHPNRSKANRSIASNPTPTEVLRAREVAGLTQAEAGKLIFSSERAVQDWETGARRMHPATWLAFLIATGQQPADVLTTRYEAIRARTIDQIPA